MDNGTMTENHIILRPMKPTQASLIMQLTQRFPSTLPTPSTLSRNLTTPPLPLTVLTLLLHLQPISRRWMRWMVWMVG